ncbi:MAG TPA: hypothetical protein DIU15_12920, partial [Deltaproteobacteria bacterium]|nr:hypothetical protein [Deltaproteobacteria bacterium]
NTGDENTDTDDGAADGDQDPTTDQDDSPADLDDAALVYADFPLESECNGVRSAAVTMQNTGTTTWTRADGYKLGAVDDSDPFYGPDTRVWLPADAVVLPGDNWTFYIDMQAPSTPGLLTTDWQMVHEAVQWFGEEAVGEVDVTCADTTEPSGWTTLACARNGAEICDDELFTAPGPGDPQLGILCENGEGGIGFVSSNTGPAQSDGVTRCQGWEDQGLDAWDYLDYVDSIVCDQAGVVLPIDLSASPGGHFWFGAHDNPGGGGHMTNICLVEWTG